MQYRANGELIDDILADLPRLGQVARFIDLAIAAYLPPALRKLKRTVELVRYPGGSHAFALVGRPSHRLDALQRVVGWFQRYL